MVGWGCLARFGGGGLHALPPDRGDRHERYVEEPGERHLPPPWTDPTPLLAPTNKGGVGSLAASPPPALLQDGLVRNCEEDIAAAVRNVLHNRLHKPRPHTLRLGVDPRLPALCWSHSSDAACCLHMEPLQHAEFVWEVTQVSLP